MQVPRFLENDKGFKAVAKNVVFTICKRDRTHGKNVSFCLPKVLKLSFLNCEMFFDGRMTTLDDNDQGNKIKRRLILLPIEYNSVLRMISFDQPMPKIIPKY